MTELICLTTLKNKIKIVRYIESNKDKTERQKERKKILKKDTKRIIIKTTTTKTL